MGVGAPRLEEAAYRVLPSLEARPLVDGVHKDKGPAARGLGGRVQRPERGVARDMGQPDALLEPCPGVVLGKAVPEKQERWLAPFDLVLRGVREEVGLARPRLPVQQRRRRVRQLHGPSARGLRDAVEGIPEPEQAEAGAASRFRLPSRPGAAAVEDEVEELP